MLKSIGNLLAEKIQSMLSYYKEELYSVTAHILENKLYSYNNLSDSQDGATDVIFGSVLFPVFEIPTLTPDYLMGVKYTVHSIDTQFNCMTLS